MSGEGLALAGMLGMTGLDFPGVISAVFFTQGCNFHCPYCHNPHLIPARARSPLIPRAEAEAFLRKRAHLLDGVVLSGGEPTLQPGLAAFCRLAKDLGYRVKLDTNGSRPEVLERLLAAGLLDYVALDCKTLPQRYGPERYGPEHNEPERYSPERHGPELQRPERCVPERQGPKSQGPEPHRPVLCSEAGAGDRWRQSAALLRASGLAHEVRTTCVEPFVRIEDAEALAAQIGPGRPWFLQRANLTEGMRQAGLTALDTAAREALAERARAAGATALLR